MSEKTLVCLARSKLLNSLPQIFFFFSIKKSKIFKCDKKQQLINQICYLNNRRNNRNSNTIRTKSFSANLLAKHKKLYFCSGQRIFLLCPNNDPWPSLFIFLALVEHQWIGQGKVNIMHNELSSAPK